MDLAGVLSAMMFQSKWSQGFEIVKINSQGHRGDRKYRGEPVDRRSDG
jgi:hypothetical protein